jgi:hypothetical protein
MHFLTPVTVVEGCEGKFRFPRQIQNHPQLYMAFDERQAANQKALGFHVNREKQTIAFPFTFGISAKRLMWEKIAFALLLLIFAVLATLGLWIQLAQDMLPPFTLESFFIIAVFFLPFGILFPILLVIAYRQTIHPDKPNRFVLHRDRIEVFYPHHRQACFNICDLQTVRLNQIQTKIKGKCSAL